MERFARSITIYLNSQIVAGAQCVQLFDSWVGCLGPDDYRRYVLPYVKQIVTGLIPGVPVINFATGNPALVPMLGQAGSSVVGVDWRIRLDDAWNQIGYSKAIQGNLEPIVLMAESRPTFPPTRLRPRTRRDSPPPNQTCLKSLVLSCYGSPLCRD